MQDRGNADLGTEMLGVSGNRQHRLRRNFEQEVIDHRLVLVGDGSDLGRQREDDVEIGDLQQLGLALFHPGKCLTALTLGAVPIAAAAVRYGGMGAFGVLAARDIAAEPRGAAGLDRAHYLQLGVAHVTAVGLTPSGTEVAEDVRDFQSRTLHDCARLLRRVRLGPQWCEQVECARSLVRYTLRCSVWWRKRPRNVDKVLRRGM